MGDKLFDRKGFRPYALRYGLCLVPALLSIFGADLPQMLLIVGIGFVVSGAVQWCLAHWENEDFLSTMWSAHRVKLSYNSTAKNEREREKQVAQRRQVALDRAKREGQGVGWFFGIAGVVVIIVSFVIRHGGE